MSQLVSTLQANGSVSAFALEFLILTATRTGETLGARWSEIDRTAKVWTISRIRMKGGRPHRVPIGRRADAILEEMGAARVNDFVFPGYRRDKPLSNMALMMMLRRLGYGEYTVHGFRSTFRDWVAENTDAPREVAEAALAHVVGDRVEAAYRRGDLFDKRRRLMNLWNAECSPATRKKRT